MHLVGSFFLHSALLSGYLNSLSLSLLFLPPSLCCLSHSLSLLSLPPSLCCPSHSLSAVSPTLPFSSDFLQPQPPAVLLAVNVTFHTATLLWGKPSEEPLNVTYTVQYWTQDSPDEIQSTNVQSVDHTLQTTVMALSPGQAYQWNVEVVNTLGSTRSLTSNFSTLSYGIAL